MQDLNHKLERFEEQSSSLDIIMNIVSLLIVILFTLSFFLTAKYEGNIFTPTNLSSFFASVQPQQAVLAILTAIFSLIDTIDSVCNAFVVNTTKAQPFTLFTIFYENVLYGYENHVILTVFQPNLPIPVVALKPIFISIICVAACSIFTLFADDMQAAICYYACCQSGLAFLTVVTCIVLQSFLPRKNTINGQFTIFVSSFLLVAINLVRACAGLIADTVFYVEASQIEDFCEIGCEVAVSISYVKWKRLFGILRGVFRRDKVEQSGLVEMKEDMVYI